MSPEERPPDQVLGERGTTAVNRAMSVQSRLSSVLAIALMSALGLGSLTWYYAQHMDTAKRRTAERAKRLGPRAQGDAALPSLGQDRSAAAASAAAGGCAELADQAAGDPHSDHLAARRDPLAVSATNGTYGAPAPKTAAQLALERQLSGAVFSTQSAGASCRHRSGAGLAIAAAPSVGRRVQNPGELSALLRSSATTAVRAQVLPAQRLLLPKGAFIDCTLETAIDSTLPGMTTCVMATDAFGVDGNVVLLERGTKLIGETRGQVQQGPLVFSCLWTEARTPAGVVVPLDSPGADELGRSGLPGEVNRHFWERFGAAMLVSVIDGAVEAAASRHATEAERSSSTLPPRREC